MALYQRLCFFFHIYITSTGANKLEFIQWKSAALRLYLFFAHAHQIQANALHYFKVHTLRGS
jgi:hypothetical protein